MAEFTRSGRGDNRGLPDNPENTPISSRTTTPGTDGRRPSSRASGFRVWTGKKYDKGKAKLERSMHKAEKGVKSLFDRGKPKNEGEGETRPQDAGGSSEVQAIAMGTFKTALSIAVALIPEPFKGRAEALLKVVDLIEKANSNKEEVEILKKHCDLLGSSIINVVKGDNTTVLSKDLRDSVERLVTGIWTTLMAANQEKSTELIAYVLAEDDEVLKKANKSLDVLLHCFWIENHIAGTIVLADFLSTVQDQAGHFEEVAAKIMPCFEGTCSALLANVGHWMSGVGADGHNPPLYILDGIAGIGKSTVAITIAQRAADPKINCLGATFFFSRDQEDQKKSLGFVHTIAYQLACYHASYGQAIAAAITSNPEALDKVLTQQFNLLVAKPLYPLLEQRATPLVLVFDALDECIEPDATAVLSLLISSVSQLPNIKIFLTTRPELGLRSKYMDAPNANIFHLQEIEDLIVEQDISLYVNCSLSPSKIQEALGDSYDPCKQPAAEDKAKLAELSGKLFIFASTAVKFILDKQHLDPKSQLASLLDSPGSLSQLGGLYINVLESAKPVENPESWLSQFKIIVGAIVALQTPLSATALERLLDQGEGAIKATLENLHSILAPSGEGSAPTYRVHHKSFSDFITSSSCPSEFQIVEQEHHLGLAKYCLQVMNRQLKFNICQVPVPSEDQFKDLDDLLKKGLNTDHISKELQYALCYWANHLSKLYQMDSNLMALLDEFSKEHLMHWLEALAYIRQLDTAHTALEKALALLVC
ncbi:hypothetical protein EST38_g5261 [Candolleomyces aberdarensis]|uniref:NACHT domain-containing protein n=1 Tax=Candolleomyces aberdarensis TaxID=2316362 RepID=A0A4Q2DMQ6_9AGAR|nr:hypothetical protein EST38_g5261 [Candolleomyces aberdarensis]